MTTDIAVGRALVADARTCHEEGWLGSSDLLVRVAEAHAAALDEIEQLRVRTTKLEAVVAALPKCHDPECAASALRRSVIVEFANDVCCDAHALPKTPWHGELSEDLPYAAALRALERQ